MTPDLPPFDPAWQVAPLAYIEKLEARPVEAVELVVIHCTELPDLVEARVAGERVLYPSGTGNSGHFYIDRAGQVHVWVPIERIAHHVRGHNARSVGIELINRGRYPDWLASTSQRMDQPYTAEQVAALRTLLRELSANRRGGAIAASAASSESCTCSVAYSW